MVHISVCYQTKLNPAFLLSLFPKNHYQNLVVSNTLKFLSDGNTKMNDV